ncbi:dTDP-4-dehydrorhamnose reductase [Dysgonomonas sp. Marseille-P4677]|uniref:dTDP-4-dehydrorhamnose reductase n=1 Tax=Dysgonomonas sp. Marseille-P4677 TaxID=2364790 RepID=UPI0019138F20|nr:dTDP-4-dehydrorhamnose reductase [Dysgonomonas sp. Marseille-P4677]MBK5722339.1 dTDP-4-dehydrorhamnose reductase [Dysgonomonas sp. Marseille-P4677]
MAFFSGNKQADDQDETAKNIFLFTLVQKNILITGANGQLGNEIRRASANHENNFRFFFTDVADLDITDREAIDSFVKENHIQYIINCAAYTAVDKAEDDIELCYRINRDATINLGIAATNNGAKIIHVSTDYVYDGSASEPYLETDSVNPQSVYGKSKLEGEIGLLNACPESIVIRTAWLYSIFGNNFVKTMIKYGKERESLNVVADQTGTPTNAADLAQAIIKILDFSEANRFEPGIYHYSNEGATTWYDFTRAIHKDAGITTCQVNPITTDQYPTKAVRPKYSVLDKTKIKTTFNLSIPKWEDSLNICIKELFTSI